MAQSPWSQGDTLEPWEFELVPDSGPFNISGLTTSNFQYYMRNVSNNTETQGSGTFNNLRAASGGNPATIAYQQSVNDVSTVGNFHQWIKVVSGGNTQTFDFGLLAIEPT